MTTMPPATAASAGNTQDSQPNGWFIVSQVKSNRIVYFTDDPAYQPTMAGDWYFVTHFLGDLPAGISLRNCWNWRFNGTVFQDASTAEPKPPLEALLVSNRRALLALLRDKINLARTDLSASCLLGDEVRRQKMHEATRFLGVLATDASSESMPEDFGLLRAVAAARNVSMEEAARLIDSRKNDTQRMLETTEHIREHYTQAISRAQTQEQLIQLRGELLADVYPKLSQNMFYPASTFEPEDWQAPLSEVHRAHEITRLQVQLRELINGKRARLQHNYLQEDTLTKHKARLAQALLSNDGKKPEGMDFSLLQNYAQARNLDLVDAARLLLGSMNEAEQVLLRTEMLKDSMQAKIESIANLSDVRRLSIELDILAENGHLKA